MNWQALQDIFVFLGSGLISVAFLREFARGMDSGEIRLRGYKVNEAENPKLFLVYALANLAFAVIMIVLFFVMFVAIFDRNGFD